MLRRLPTYLALLLLPSMIGIAVPSREVAAQEPTPDIIVVMVDDLGYIPKDTVLRRLPNIKRTFIDNGQRFTQMYNETPLCCPARAHVLTGQHTLHHGVIANNALPFDHDDTLITALTPTYNTMLVGKYMNDYSSPTMMPPGWDQVFLTAGITRPSFFVDGVLTPFEGAYSDDVIATQAVTWLSQAPEEQPAFLLATPRSPHRQRFGCERRDIVCKYLPSVMERDEGASECQGIPDLRPPNYEIIQDREHRDMVDWPDGWKMTRICESLLVVDRMVGGLVEAQSTRGRPAYFFFMSDNGMSWGQKSEPFKHVPTATRLPFYVNGPGVAPGTNGTLLSIIDIAMTIAEIAGIALPDADGMSFVPILRSLPFSGRREVLEIMPPPPSYTNEEYEGWAAIRTNEWRFIRWDDGRKELFDLGRDPWELENLVDARPDRVVELERRLDRLIEESLE